MQAQDRVELRPGDDGTLDAVLADRRVAVLVEQPGPPAARLILVGRATPIEPAEVGGLLDAVWARPPVGEVELVTNDPLVRDFARRRGFTGPLRGALVPGPGDPLPWTDDPVTVHTRLQQLLPDVSVQMEETPGPTRSLLRRAVSGVAKTFDLFAAPDDGARPSRFSVPQRNDLLVESVARCIDTTIAIRRRFGRASAGVRRVSFDVSDFQLLHGVNAGSADRTSGIIHMNANLASVEGLTAMEQTAAARAAGHGMAPRPFIPLRSPEGAAARCNQIDGTTAHEMWHQMEGQVEARRSMDGIELRRRLGEALGVETLEQAVNGSRPRAPEPWKAAYARLVTEVSPYAGTAPVEATAEMFKLWWCGDGERTPIVQRFGELAEPWLDGLGG